MKRLLATLALLLLLLPLPAFLHDEDEHESSLPINVAKYLRAGDLGQAYAAAYLVHGERSYFIPNGVYYYSHTISIVPIDTGQTSLQCAPGAHLIYTGSGDAFAVLGTGQSKIGHVLDGCTIIGNPAAVSGIHLAAVNGAIVSNVIVSDFVNGDGAWNQGANTIQFNNVTLTGNKRNVHNVGAVVGGVNYAANAIHFTGGALDDAGQFEIFEDASMAWVVGMNQDNTYRDLAIEGSHAPTQIYVQGCESCSIGPGIYLEFPVGVPTEKQIILGDPGYLPVSVWMDGNIIVPQGTPLADVVSCVHCSGPSQ